MRLLSMIATPALLICLAAAGATRYGLLVGSNRGGGDLAQLKYAERDAQRFAHLLSSLAGFRADNVVTVVRPDSAAVARQLDRMDSLVHAAPEGRDGSLFLFYYSGHANERRLLFGEGGGFALKRLQSFLDTMPASIRIGIFDACQSGAVTAMKGGTRAEPFYFESQQSTKGQVIIASSAVNEQAQESEALKGSIFSHHWLNGLRGSADLSGDKLVTLNEAYEYAYRKTIETTALTGGGVQHPVYRFNILGQGDIVLTNLAQGVGGVVLDKECAGKFLILSDDYTNVLADFSKKRGQELAVALPAGGYTAISAAGRDVKMRAFSVAESGTYHLDPADMTESPLTVSRIKGANAAAAAAIEPAPLSTYSAGIGAAGLFVPKADDAGGHRAVALSWVNRVRLERNVDLFFDIGAAFPDASLTGQLGLDRMWRGSLTPFVGAGAGIGYIDKTHGSFDACFGPLVTVRAGLSMTVNRRADVEIVVPWTVVFTRTLDQRVGLEARLVWGGQFRDVRVDPEGGPK